MLPKISSGEILRNDRYNRDLVDIERRIEIGRRTGGGQFEELIKKAASASDIGERRERFKAAPSATKRRDTLSIDKQLLEIAKRLGKRIEKEPIEIENQLEKGGALESVSPIACAEHQPSTDSIDIVGLFGRNVEPKPVKFEQPREIRRAPGESERVPTGAQKLFDRATLIRQEVPKKERLSAYRQALSSLDQMAGSHQSELVFDLCKAFKSIPGPDRSTLLELLSHEVRRIDEEKRSKACEALAHAIAHLPATHRLAGFRIVAETYQKHCPSISMDEVKRKLKEVITRQLSLAGC